MTVYLLCDETLLGEFLQYNAECWELTALLRWSKRNRSKKKMYFIVLPWWKKQNMYSSKDCHISETPSRWDNSYNICRGLTPRDNKAGDSLWGRIVCWPQLTLRPMTPEVWTESQRRQKKKEDGGEEKSEEVNEEMRRLRGEKKQSQSCCCREIGVKVSLVKLICYPRFKWRSLPQ